MRARNRRVYVPATAHTKSASQVVFGGAFRTKRGACACVCACVARASVCVFDAEKKNQKKQVFHFVVCEVLRELTQ